MKTKIVSLLLLMIGGLFPFLAQAQTTTGVDQLHNVLAKVYDQMIPLVYKMLNVCQAIAVFGSTFYIGFRVWKHIAKAEPIDFFPLFRHFVMTLMIVNYSSVLAIINGILKPSVTATAALVQNSNDAVNVLLEQDAKMIVTGDTATAIAVAGQLDKGSGTDWGKYSQPTGTDSNSGGGLWATISSSFKFLAGGVLNGFRYVFKFLLSILLELLFFAASLCIDTVRTFHLVVLAIMGPFALAFSCYDGFQHSLTHWLSRYINIYLWLPVANLLGAILGKIQENMLQIDIARAKSGAISLFSATDFAYLIFLLMGVVAYFTVPGLTSYIVHTHGPNPLSDKVSKLAGGAVMAVAGGGGGAGIASAMGGSGGNSANSSGASGYEDGKGGAKNEPYQYSKIAG